MANITLLNDIGVVVIAATLIAIIIQRLRQPLILGYVVAGVIIGPLVAGLISDPSTITILSELGIMFLMFIIGMELDLSKLKGVGTTSAFIGLLQVIFTALLGFGAAQAFGLDIMRSIYIGLIVSFSSTLVVLKLLSDRNDLDSLHGQIVLGIMVIQDILAVLALSLLTSINEYSAEAIEIILLKGIAIVAVAYIIYRFIFPYFFREAVRSTELLFISSLTIMFSFAALAYQLDYSLAIGAFVAGVCLGSTTFRHEIQGRVKPLKDFFLVMFFVTLGMQIAFDNITNSAVVLTILVVLALIVKPILTFFIMKFLRYSNRTAFLSSIKIAQIGEFSLILVAQGIIFGHIGSNIFSVTILITILTMVLTAYILKYEQLIFKIFEPLIKPFDSWLNIEEEKFQNLTEEKLKNHTIILGYHRTASLMIKELIKTNKKFVVVDYNPDVILRLIKKDIQCICSTITNPDLYNLVNVKDASMIVSAVHTVENNVAMVSQIRDINKNALVIVVARYDEEAEKLYEAGADLVIVPGNLTSRSLANLVSKPYEKKIRELGQIYYEELHQSKKLPVDEL